MKYCPLEMTAIKFSGEDALNFLQGQLTADLNKLETGNAVFCAHCNLKGRMTSLGWLFSEGNDFYYVVPKSIVELTINKLQRYIMRSKVKIEVDDRPLFGCWDLTGTKIDNQRSISFQEPEGEAVDLSLWQYDDIQGQLPWLSEETSGEFLPAEINLAQHGGVSLTKGCFIGQEIIARMHYLGKSKKKMIVTDDLNQGKLICQCVHDDKDVALMVI